MAQNKKPQASTAVLIGMDNQPYDVPAGNVEQALATGNFRMEAPEELKKRLSLEKYGTGVGNTVAAAAAGAARGATAGLSDLALGETGLVDKETLTGLKEGNPIASGIGEVGGAVFSPLNKLVGPAELALSRGLNPGAAVAKTALQAIVPKAVVGAAEGAAYNMGTQLSEDYLGDHDITAEKLLAAGGMGALLGGGIAGFMSGTAYTARKTLDKMMGEDFGQKILGKVKDTLSPKNLDSVAEQSAFAHLAEGRSTYAKKAEESFGVNKVGREIIDSDILKATDAQDRAALAYSKKREFGDKIDNILKNVDVNGPTINSEEVYNSIKKVVDSDTLKIASNKRLNNQLNNFLDQVTEKQIVFRPKMSEQQYDNVLTNLTKYSKFLEKNNPQFDNDLVNIIGEAVTRSPPEQLYNALQAYRSTLTEVPGVQSAFDRYFKHINSNLVEKEAVKFKPLSASELQQFRINFGSEIAEASEKYKPLVNKLRQMDRSLEGAVESAVDKSGQLADYKIAKEKYNIYKLVESMAKSSKNRSLVGSLGTKELPVSTLFAAQSALSGNFLSAAGSLGLGSASKYAKENGHKVVAELANKMAKMQYFAKLSQNLDTRIQTGLQSFFGGVNKGTKAAIRAGMAEASQFQKKPPIPTYEEMFQRLNDLNNPMTAANELSKAGIGESAPNVNAAFNAKAMNAVSKAINMIPRGLKPLKPFEMQKIPKLNDYQKGKFKSVMTAVIDPVSVVDDMAKGKLNFEAVDTVKELYPKLYSQIQETAVQMASENGDKMNYTQRVQLSVLLGTPLDDTLQPQFVQMLQNNLQDMNQQAQQAQEQQRARASTYSGGAAKKLSRDLTNSIDRATYG